MRLLHISALSCAALALMAANTDAGGEGEKPADQPISAPLDGQIALTAYNCGDGTWEVRRGPDGTALKSGLAREEALAIVGATTGPYVPATEVEAEASAKRAEVEEAEAKREETALFASDAEAGDPSKVANHDLAKASEENAELRSALASKDEQIQKLQAQVAKFDGDKDGKVGGKSKADPLPADAATKNGAE